MNFCNENNVILKFRSSLPLSFSTISDASIIGELTSLIRDIMIDDELRNGMQKTHFSFTLSLIFLLKLSSVTSSSFSSLNANITGGSWIFKFTHNCLITSSTANEGSIRARTVWPSFVVTVFVGTSTPGRPPPLPLLFPEALLAFALEDGFTSPGVAVEAEVVDEFDGVVE
jgi:hypothetical protein